MNEVIFLLMAGHTVSSVAVARSRQSSGSHSGAGAGMTIMEVLIAMTLLALVVFGAIGAISHSTKLVHHARMITLSSQVLQSAVEGLRLRNYSDIAAYAAQAQPVDLTPAITGEFLGNNFTSGMALRAEFGTLHPSGDSSLGLVTLTLTVSWAEGDQTYTRSAVTRFGEKGLSDYIHVGF